MSPSGGVKNSRGTLAQRLLRRVAIDTETGCWLFLGGRDRSGYGIIGVGTAKSALAHRVCYQLFCGPIPEGHDLHHKCENKSCVNPEHLEPLTRRQHLMKTPSFGAHRTHCPQGHEYTPDNLASSALKTRGARQCRACLNERNRAYYARTKAQKKAYADANHERIRDGQRARYAADPERHAAYSRAYLRRKSALTAT